MEPISKKFESFNWDVVEIDGHDFSQIRKALNLSVSEKQRPRVIIANTIKGKGVSFMENKLEWHYKSVNKKEMAKAVRELDNS